MIEGNLAQANPIQRNIITKSSAAHLKANLKTKPKTLKLTRDA